MLLPVDSTCPCCQRFTLTLSFVRLFFARLLGQSLPVLAHRLKPPLRMGVSSGRGDPWTCGRSGILKTPVLSFPSPYLCHRSAAGSASGVRFPVLPGKKADASFRCEDVFGHDGEELLARFLLRLGVSCVEELLGIQPMCSSGDCSFWTTSFLLSTSPIRSSNESFTPGVDGKVFA